MRIVFAGSPAFSVPALNALAQSGADIVAVITQPDKPVGRKKILTPTPVKQRAAELDIPVYDRPRIRDCVQEVKALNADIMITSAYGQILTQEILDCFKLGVWNMHASLLPKFRGASPVQSAILAGEKYTGITVMKTELSLDTGDILLVKRMEIGERTYGELEKELSILAAEAAVETVKLINSGEVQLLMQDEAKATYCKKISKSDGKINFNKPAQEICGLVRAMNPQPLAFCNFGEIVLNILAAEPVEYSGGEQQGTVISADKHGIKVRCEGGAVNILELLPSGGKKMTAADFVNGRKIKAGDRLD